MAAPTCEEMEDVFAGVRPRGFAGVAYVPMTPTGLGTEYFVSKAGSDSNPGTSGSPFLTVNKAAEVATTPGDVVTIGDGNWDEDVTVMGAGTESNNIVFQAANRGAQSFGGSNDKFFRPANWNNGVKNTGQIYITLHGLKFQEYAQLSNNGNKRHSCVGAIKGWKTIDCSFYNAGYTGVNCRGNDILIDRSTFEAMYVHAFTAAGHTTSNKVNNPTFRDLILRGNHTTPTPAEGASATRVMKLWYTHNAEFDNIESYENIGGAGIWLDTENTDYHIHHCYLHHNTGTSGRAILLEKNRAAGLIENCISSHNEASGLGLFNVSGLLVQNCISIGDLRWVFWQNKEQWWDPEHPDYPPEPTDAPWILEDVDFQNNFIKDWVEDGAYHAPNNTGMSTMQAMNLTANNNTYDPGVNSIISTLGGNWTTLAQLQAQHNWEANGAIALGSTCDFSSGDPPVVPTKRHVRRGQYTKPGGIWVMNGSMGTIE